MSESNPPPSPSSATEAQAQVGSEHLLNLHKMSTTAGVGTTEYVAVNSMAVVAVICGVASLLTLLGYILLVIPLVGIATGIVSIIQVSHSSGTQTGRGLALLGIALSILIGGGKLTYDQIKSMQRQADTVAIADLCTQLSQDIKLNKFDEAYELFDSTFHNRVLIGEFRARLTGLQHGGSLPPYDFLDWNSVAPEFDTLDTGEETARAMIRIHFTVPMDPSRMDIRVKKIEGVWKFDDINEIFPPPKGQAPDTPVQN